jgi:2-oxoglutarate ferredoxin oxidoreductase subunit beta
VVAEPDGSLRIVDTDEVGEERLLVHDEHDRDAARAFSLSRLAHSPTGPTPLGVFRAVERPVYEDLMQRQVDAAVERSGPGDLDTLLRSGDTWQVG